MEWWHGFEKMPSLTFNIWFWNISLKNLSLHNIFCRFTIFTSVRFHIRAVATSKKDVETHLKGGRNLHPTPLPSWNRVNLLAKKIWTHVSTVTLVCCYSPAYKSCLVKIGPNFVGSLSFHFKIHQSKNLFRTLQF